jgi:hypothetical protein
MDKQETGLPFSVIDFALLLLALAMPYLVATTSWWRFAIAAIAMIVWIVAAQPTWRGLQNFFSVMAMLLHTVIWLGISIARLF